MAIFTDSLMLIKQQMASTILPSNTWKTVVSLGINSKTVTKRGVRSGMHKRRAIPTKISSRMHRAEALSRYTPLSNFALGMPVSVSLGDLSPKTAHQRKTKRGRMPANLIRVTANQPNTRNSNSTHTFTVVTLNCRSAANKTLASGHR